MRLLDADGHSVGLASYSGLYVGDLFAVLKALVRAELEAHALTRYEMDPEIADAVAELAAGITRQADLAKWVQNQVRGIDWHERPAA